MDGIEVARELAGDGRVLAVDGGRHRVFRVWGIGPPRLIKVYPSPEAAEREQRTLALLGGIPGIPTVMATGWLSGRAWASFPDPGASSIASLPDNRGFGRQAGRILAAVHAAGTLSDPGRGIIDGRWVRANYVSLFSRLSRYRGRLGVAGGLLEAAGDLPPPKSSPPVPSHTDPLPGLFFVGETGKVTLLHWDGMLAAPPEWDYTLARWSIRSEVGPAAAAGLAEGYGASFDRREIDHWTIYHAGMMLLRLAEDLDACMTRAVPLVAALEAAVVASRRSLI